MRSTEERLKYLVDAVLGEVLVSFMKTSEVIPRRTDSCAQLAKYIERAQHRIAMFYMQMEEGLSISYGVFFISVHQAQQLKHIS